MNRVTFEPAGGDLSGTHERAGQAVSCAGGARASFFRGKVRFRSLAYLLALTVLFGSKPARAAEQPQLKGHVPAAIQRMKLQSTGALPATNRLSLAIGLPLRNRAALDTLLQQIYDPGSPNYHKYLTREQFTQQFGPTEQDYQALVDFAQASGLEVVGRPSNRMLLDVKGAVADIEKAFQVKMRVYQHPKENRTFFAPDVEPTAPAGLPVLDISGLNNFGRPHPLLVSKPLGRAQTNGAVPNVGSGPAGTFFGYDFRAAYAPGVTLDGGGETLALVEFDGYLASDIADYDLIAGLPQVPLRNVLLDGFNGAPTGTGGEQEVSLDIEMANAMAPGLFGIISYEGNPNNFIPNDVLNEIAADNAAREISCSWGWTGGPSATTDQIHLQMNAQGQSFFQASGDDDSLATGEADDPTLPFTPSANPYVISVGATGLTTTGPLGSFVSETVWQEGGGFGSTGGFSTNYAIPTWQAPVIMTNNGGSTNYRNFPDVAMAGSNILVIADSGSEFDMGGTSCAAPLWAAFMALVNQKAALTGSAPMGFVNPALYSISLGPSYSACFHDVTNGNNFSLTNTNQFLAVPGYDLCTGWGSPTGQALIDTLVPAIGASPLLIILTNTLSGGNGNGRIDPNECNNLTVLITNLGTAAATHVEGILTSLTPGVVMGQSRVTFPDIPVGGSARNQTAFTISTEPTFVCGTTISLKLVVKCDQTIQSSIIQFTTGTIGSPVRFDNSTPLVIPAGGAVSTINVSNISIISKATVSLYLTTPVAEYMELYLMSPEGNFVYLALVDGGLGANFGSACAPESSRTTFDDAATQSILSGTAPLVGTYSPETPLSTLNGLSGPAANGPWQLYAYNLLSSSSSAATTLQCWSLFITPEICGDGGGQCPGADLSVTMTANPITAPTASPVIYTLSVSNAGPSPASNAVVNLTLPSGIVYQGSVSSQGTASQVGSIVTFSLGTVAVQSGVTIMVTTLAVTPGLMTSTAVVGSPASDSNPNNNQASASVVVTKRAADLGLTMSVTPIAVPENGQTAFLVAVTNNGPATALGVTVTNSLPPNVNVVSVSASQGSVSAGGTLASIGTMLPGAGAMETLVLSPTVVGTSTLTSTVGLDPSETDPVLANNSASASVNVLPAADLGVSVVVLPSPAVSGGFIAYQITVTNGGPATATSVIMNQTLPAGVKFVSASQTTAVDQNGVVTWTITSNMPSGTSQTLTTTIRAPTLLQGVVSNVLVSSFSVFGQPGNPNPSHAILTVSTLVMRPTIIITPLGDTLTSEGFQPANGAVNPGETVGVQFQLQNVGNIPTTNLVATFQTNGGAVPVAGYGQANYGALAPGGGVGSGQFLFTANSTNGGTVVATLQLQDGLTNLGTVSFTFVMPVVSTFWNTNVIFIPATNFVPAPASGPAAPYPSSVQVSGISAYVSGVAVTVSNLQHTDLNDINMLLVGPGGQSSVLMGGAAYQSTASFPVTITFDQNASAPLPGGFGGIVSGSYRPAAYDSPNFTNSNLSPPYNANLSVFEGISPNGRWSLYVYDGATGDYGAISNGWAVAVTTITPVNQITDLGLAIAASTNQVILGSNVTFTITVTNAGTNTANVLLTNVLGAGLSFVSNTVAPSAPYQQIGQAQYYNLGALAGQTNLTLGFVAKATAAGLQTSTASIGSSLIDPNTNNNQAGASITVALPVADVSAAIASSAGAGAVVVGSNVIYTLTVSNSGPDLALNVFGLLTQGVAGPASMVFSNYFGAVAPGFIATALFSNAPAAAGLLTNTWTVSTGSSDTNPGNNTAALANLATYPVPVIVINSARLLTESFVPPNGAVDSNETVSVAFTLENTGAAPTTNLTATLLSGNGVIPITTSQNYGVINPGASTAQSFSFTGQGVPGSTITAVLSLKDNAYSLGTVSFPFTIAAPLSFTNSGPIIIPDSGPGTPYPSLIAVSATNGVVGRVTATLRGFTHSFPHDVNVLLTSPSGQQAVLMAHVGGPSSVTNVVLAFDDAATNSLTETALVSGTNHPTLVSPLDSYPAIAGQPSNTNLSVFNGSNPNGFWSLYVYDDTPGNNGSIANGWTLGLTLVNPVNPPVNLAVAMTHGPDPVFTDNILTFQITVTNLGPSGATNVFLTDTLPAAAGLLSASASQGTVNTNVAGAVTFDLGIITNAGGTAAATIQVQPLRSGLAFNAATVTNADGAGAGVTNLVTVLNAAPFFLQVAYQAGNLTLTLEGQANQDYIIQVSTNLTTWASVSTNTAVGAGQFTFTNSLTNAPARFYRALHLPQ